MIGPAHNFAATGAWLAVAVALCVMVLPNCKIAPTYASSGAVTNDDSGDDWLDYINRDRSSDYDDDDSEYGASIGANIGTRAECQGYTCGFRSTCGRAPLNKIASKARSAVGPYIVNGEDQIHGEWPSFVTMLVYFGDEPSLCGGVLVSDRHVLTTARCVDHDDEKLNFVGLGFGLHNISAQWYKKNKSVYVSKFFRTTDGHDRVQQDWAVVTLRDAIRFTNYIQPACLPYGYTKGRKYQNCHLVGAGATSGKKSKDGKYQYEKIVQKMPVEQVSCEKMRSGSKYESETLACYGKAGKSQGGTICHGDAGSPILCIDPTTKRWTVIGAANGGAPECDDEMNWIIQATKITTLLPNIKAETEL